MIRRHTDSEGISYAMIDGVDWEQAAREFQQITATPVSQRDIPTIKAWRKRQHDAGLPSGLDDFYVLNDFCIWCRGTGWKMVDGACGWHYRGCDACRGTGRTCEAEVQS